MDALADFGQVLGNPDVAFLLFVAGAILLTIELVNPTILGGFAGVVLLILAFIGFSTLPVNWWGVALIALGFILFLAETQITSHGLLTVAGVVAIVIGATMLYNVTPAPPGGQVVVSTEVIVLVGAVAALAGFGIAWAAVRTRRMKATPGTVGTTPPAGTPGVVQAPLGPLGTVQLGGESWSARTPDERLVPRDTPVRLVAFDGLVAIVEVADPELEPPPPPANMPTIPGPTPAAPATRP
jgi:membrane-bound serine protease (ClpP class)